MGEVLGGVCFEWRSEAKAGASCLLKRGVVLL